MKKIKFLFVMLISLSATAQITFSHKNGAWCGVWLDKLHLSGYKNVEWRCAVGTNTINIYNLNNTLFKSIAVTTPTPYTIQEIAYVSENLFDLDNSIEYLVVADDTSKFNVQAVFVFDEAGPQLFYRDSAEIEPMAPISGYALNSIFQSREAIYFDGVSTKMRLRMHSGTDYETYNLPGTVPCAMCTSGIVSGLSSAGNDGLSPVQNAEFFPNPASNELKLKYRLPEGTHYAEIKIYDTTGKLIDDFKVTDSYDFIYLPTNYNNGLYLYSLIVDGMTVKTEKIVLNK